MAESKIIINGQEFPLHYRLLLEIARNLPASGHYMELARAIVGLNIPSLTVEIIRKHLLDRDMLDTIWEYGDLDTRRGLVREKNFRRNLTDDQAMQIMRADDAEIWKTLASWAEELCPGEAGGSPRLGPENANRLLEMMACHANPEIRKKFVENRQAPERFKPAFRECVELGIDADSLPFSSMRPADIPLLASFSHEMWTEIANAVEDITSERTREMVVEKLRTYPDPSVRLALANNLLAPKTALRLLLEDSDQDVVTAVKINLDRKEQELDPEI